MRFHNAKANTVQPMRSANATPATCSEEKEPIALHLRAITNWKQFVHSSPTRGRDSRAIHAWARALEAERALFAHREAHGCNSAEA